MGPFLAGFTSELLKVAEDTVQVQVDIDKALRAAKRESKNPSAISNALGQIRDNGPRVSRNYLRSALLGAGAGVFTLGAGRGIRRALRNREVMQAIETAPLRRKAALRGELKTGPLLGREFTAEKRVPNTEPLITTPELIGQAGGGGLLGSVFQALRDRLTPPITKDQNRP